MHEFDDIEQAIAILIECSKTTQVILSIEVAVLNNRLRLGHLHYARRYAVTGSLIYSDDNDIEQYEVFPWEYDSIKSVPQQKIISRMREIFIIKYNDLLLSTKHPEIDSPLLTEEPIKPIFRIM